MKIKVNPAEQERYSVEAFKEHDFEACMGKTPIYSEFVRKIPAQYKRGLMRLIQFSGSQNADQTKMEFIAATEFLYPLYIAWCAGMRKFEIASGLASLVKDTDIPDISVEFLKLPFEGIVLLVPKNTFSGKYHAVQRIYVCLVDGDSRFRLSFLDDKAAVNYMNMVVIDPTLDEKFKAATIKDAVDTTISWDRIQKIIDPDMWKYHVGERFEQGAKSELFRFVINAVLYISSPDSDVEEDNAERRRLHQKLQGMKGGRKRRKVEEQLKEIKSRHIYIVGRKQKTDDEYEKIANARPTEEGRKILKRFRVRGHFRLQPYGKGSEKRKISWVKPHFRGPTFAELVQKGYIVK